MTRRIWELDALRGICILGMVAVHLVYDLTGMGVLPPSAVLAFLQEWGGIVFLLLSGICVTLGRRHIRRGLTVFACGMLCTAVTALMFALDLSDPGIIIYFGVLHCLGVCMLLWSGFSRLPAWALALCAAAAVTAGLYLDGGITVDFPWLIPLGLRFPGFVSSDYFPLFPNLGYFLLGAVLGRTVYKSRQSLFPGADPGLWPIRFLSCCGRHSLLIYLLHQPLLTALLWLMQFFHR